MLLLDHRFKAEYLEDKEGALEELTSEAAAVTHKKKPPTRQDEEETPPPKQAEGLAAILENVPKRNPVELTSCQQAKKEIISYSDLPLEDTSSDHLDFDNMCST